MLSSSAIPYSASNCARPQPSTRQFECFCGAGLVRPGRFRMLRRSVKHVRFNELGKTTDRGIGIEIADGKPLQARFLAQLRDDACGSQGVTSQLSGDGVVDELALCEIGTIDVAQADPRTADADFPALPMLDGAELIVQNVDAIGQQRDADRDHQDNRFLTV